ncbi:KilA-N domain-containing protein [Devosia sp. A8/3-2]|nr:KilA-N domain-containing protein [Devosia sp. A8/3-2]
MTDYSGPEPQGLPARTGNALSYHGVLISDRGENLSLTDMWRAAGSPPNQEPFNWARFDGRAFIEAVAVTHNLSDTQVMTTKRGKGGSTMAHWQVGLAYAKYLSHDFHMWANRAVREKMEGKAFERLHGLTRGDKFAIGGIIKQTMPALLREQLGDLLPAMLNSAIMAHVAEHSILLRHGKTAKQIWDDNRLPPKLRGATVWLGNRLAEMSCCIENEGRADRGNGTVRLF